MSEKWDRDAIDSLLRFGRKNDGPWNDTEGIDKNGRELYMPDDGDTDLVAAAPEMLEALRRVDNYFTQPGEDDWIRFCKEALEPVRRAIKLAIEG